ncbi:MAG: formate dehydrogenase accessory protein FdhE [Gemmatimonadota bacterium]
MSPAQIAMPWTAASIGTAGRFSGSAEVQVDPAWQPWLDLLEIALEADGRAWSSVVPANGDRPAGAPLLEGTTLRVDSSRAKTLVRRLAHAAGVSRVNAIDPTRAIRASITRDESALAEMAELSGVSANAFAVVAQAAAMPVLHAVTQTMSATAAAAWTRGYCPVCGAWPSLAELRGLERERRLRCGCCSADWPLALLRCAYCDERDHEKLGTLLPEGEEQFRLVETCESCHGYLKAVTTIAALSDRALILLDLSTVPLDLVAHDRGYARPARPGWAPSLEIVS